MSQSCIIIGAGNLATHLAIALKKNGHIISQVYNRSEIPAKQLAVKMNSDYTSDPSQVKKDATVYFVAVKDDAIEEVISTIKSNNKLLVHCSGSTPMSVLSKYSTNYGVLYPLQTFSKERDINFKKIPLFIEANTLENLGIIEKIAKDLSDSVSKINSEKRQTIHVAAMFACNFVNHLYTLSGDLLKEQDIAFSILKPLIAETADKIKEIEPFYAQTGPAVRNDKKLIKKHLKKLKHKPELLELYKSLSNSIFKHHQK